MRKPLIIIFICFIQSQCFAFKFTPEICERYGLGKNWYCEESTKKDNETNANEIMSSNLTPEQKAFQLNQLWEQQRQRAVITTNRKDIEQFLETHNLIINKGIDFAKVTQNLIENSPILANSENYYKNLSDQQSKEKEKQKILKNAGSRYGLVFIYSSTCRYCHKQLPILLELQSKIRVMGISTDGNYFEGLHENITDENIVNDPLVQAFPTILLLDKKRPAKIFISKGLTSLETLEEKIVRRISERENEEN